MKIDGHQHFWSLRRDDYDWLTPDLLPLYRDFMPADLRPLLTKTGVDRTVLVQAAATTNESRFLLDIADQQSMVAGVVGWVDMDSPDAAILALDEFARHPKFVGIRPMIQDIEDPAWISRREHDEVLTALTTKDLCFDALVRSEHLPHLLSSLSRHPQLKVIVDHGAKPDIAGGEWQPWADYMTALASETSVYCKLSGLITEAGSGQNYDDTLRYVDHLLSEFGPDRLVWGSDWPVLNIAGDYDGWHDAACRFLDRLPESDQQDVLGNNAMRFYKLDTENKELDS